MKTITLVIAETEEEAKNHCNTHGLIRADGSPTEDGYAVAALYSEMLGAMVRGKNRE